MLSLAGRADRLARTVLLVCLLVLASTAGVAPALGQTEGEDAASESGTNENRTAPISEESWQLWDSADTEESWSTESTSPLWVAGRVLVAVLLVASLVILLMFLVRRFGLGRGASGIGAPRLQLLASLSLAPRRTVYLVRVDGVELLVGTAGDGLRLLTELPGTRDAALPGFSGGATGTAAFGEQSGTFGSATLGNATPGSGTLGSATLDNATLGSATPGSATPGSATVPATTNTTRTMMAATGPTPPSPAGDDPETGTFLAAFSNLLGFNPPATHQPGTPDAEARGR